MTAARAKCLALLLACPVSSLEPWRNCAANPCTDGTTTYLLTSRPLIQPSAPSTDRLTPKTARSVYHGLSVPGPRGVHVPVAMVKSFRRDIVQSKADIRAADMAKRAAEYASRRHERPADVASAWYTSASGYRPALLQATTHQRIPRRIFQLGNDFASVMSGRNAKFVEQWWTLNPDYEYAFFNDSHARRYVMARASPNESQAYLYLLRGAQRADLFRMIWIKYEGGIYADLDSKPLNLLRSVIPPKASAYTGRSWSFEFLAYEPMHPIIHAGLEQMTKRVLAYVEALKQDAPKACLNITALVASNSSQKTCFEKSRTCFGAHRYVISTTGPLAYQAGVGEATHRLNCRNNRRVFRMGECRASTSIAMQRVHVCEDPRGAPSLLERLEKARRTCNVSLHLDCRNSNGGAVRGTKCKGTHYSKVGPSPFNFYSTTPLLKGAPPDDKKTSVRVENSGL